MSAPRLSPAMRNMLRNIVNGQRSTRGLAGGPLKHAATRRALEARGLLDQDLKPTAAGLAVFGHRNPHSYVVWHLIGPQGCGKTTYANSCTEAIKKLGGASAWMESHEFQALYGSNPERLADDYPGLTVLMVEDSATRPGDTPPHYMLGDRIIDLTDYLPNRRPGIEGVQTKIRLNQPDWSEDKVQTQAKHQYEAHIVGRFLEGATC